MIPNRSCPHEAEDLDLIRQRRTMLMTRDITTDTDVYYVSVSFWVVNNGVTVDQVNQQLVVLNNAFNGKLDPPAEFLNDAGNFNITFELAEINFVTTNEQWGDLTDMWGFIGQHNTANNLNVYINTYTTSNLLGQASSGNDTINNCVTIRTDTLDSGVFNGMTLAHEVGHICGLMHPFYYGCSGSPFDDITPSFEPNYFALPTNQFNNNNLDNGAQEADFLEYWSQEAWNSKANPASCNGDIPEQGVNIMDYALDNALLMFSKDQVVYGRSEFGIRARNIDVRGAPSTTGSSINTDPSSSSGSSSTSWIIWVAVGLGVLLVIFMIYYFMNRKKK